MAGKKRGSSRQRKRADAAFKETVENQIAKAEDDKIIEKSEAGELFVLDTAGDENVRLNIKNEKKARKNRNAKRPEVQVQNLMEKHNYDAAALQKLTKKAKKVKARANFDLWNDAAGDEDDSPASTIAAMIKPPVASSKSKAPPAFKNKKTVAVEVPHGGQSYKPDVELHQDVIGEALAIELRRNEATEDSRTPISNGLSEETLKFIDMRDDEDSDSDSDSDIDQLSDKRGTPKAGIKKKQEKLTRAQRNKQKKVKGLEARLRERKIAKQFTHQINESKKISKEVAREERQKLARHSQIQKLREDRESRPLGANLHEEIVKENPIKAPALPVALSSELQRDGASLRTVKAKGSLVEDRLLSMAARKMVFKKRPTRKVTQGKRRMKPGKGNEYLLH